MITTWHGVESTADGTEISLSAVNHSHRVEGHEQDDLSWLRALPPRVVE